MQGMQYTENRGGKTRLYFSKEFYRGEFRCGFFVSTNMKHMWAAQLEVLSEVDRICKKHDIVWYADSGTLLGAVRHQGFIPWDDDIDIAMLRKDYIKFCEICEQELDRKYIFIRPYEIENFDQVFVRVADNLEWKNPENIDEYHDTPYMAGIDIFPLDYLAPDEEEARLQVDLSRLIDTVRMDSRNKKVIHTDAFLRELMQVEEACHVQFDREGNLERQLGLLFEKICCLYTEEEAKELTVFPLIEELPNWRFRKEWYRDTVLSDYEGLKIPCPVDYDKILTAMYGDYHKFQRGTAAHDYPFYKSYKENINFDIESEMRESLQGDLANFFHVSEEEVCDIHVIKFGFKNKTVKFSIAGKKYLIRMPNLSIRTLADYMMEEDIYKALKGMEITDDAFFFSKENGIKMSLEIEGAHPLDVGNKEEVAACFEVVSFLHGLGDFLEPTFDLWDDICKYEEFWGDSSFYPDYKETKEKLRECYDYILEQPKQMGIVHFDLSADNFLISEIIKGERDIRLIDWEYAGVQDIHIDLAMFALLADYSGDELEWLMEIYFGEHPSEEVRSKIYCYMALCSFLLCNYYEYLDRNGEDMTQEQAGLHQTALDYYEAYRTLVS